MKKHFIIYAPAINIKTAGAHSILESFISSLEGDLQDFTWKFVGNKDYETLCKQRNVEFIELNLNSQWMKRILYDFCLFKLNFLKKETPPTVVISMQNTPPLIRNCDISLTYLHQAIPFISSFHPHPIKQWKIFLIKHFYAFFIQFGLHKPRSFFIVQSEWLKKMIAAKFNIQLDHIFVHRPLPSDIQIEAFAKTKCDTFFYPAIFQEYKNHRNLIAAFIWAAKENPHKNFELGLTLEISQLNSLLNNLEKTPTNLIVKNHGILSRHETLKKINEAKALVFPSLVESYGMPIAEALFFKTPVLASRLPYAEELLGNSGVYFDPFNIESIKEAIVNFDPNISKNMELSRDRFQNWRDILSQMLEKTS